MDFSYINMKKQKTFTKESVSIEFDEINNFI